MKPAGRLLKSVLTIGSAASLANLFLIAYSVLIARWLGPSSYGVIAANISLTSLTFFVVNWGFDTWLLHKLPQSDNPPKVAGQVLFLKFSLGCLWGLLLWLVAPIISPKLFPRFILDILILNSLLDSGINVFYVVLVASNRINVSSTIFVTARFFRLITAIILIFLNCTNISNFVLTRLIVDFFCFSWAWVSTKKQIKFNKSWIQNNIFHQALSYGWSEFLITIYYQVDINLITILSQNQQLIGHYSIVISLTNAIAGIIQSVNNILLPVFTRLFMRKDFRLIQAIYVLFSSSILLGLVLWLGIAFLGIPIVHSVLGEKYDTSALFLVSLSPVFFLKSLSLAATMLLVALDLQKQRLISQMIAVGLKVLLTVIVFPSQQITGIIWVYILCELTMVVGHFWILLKWYWESRHLGLFTL